MKRIALITDDEYFFLKCSLLLDGIAEISKSPADAQIVAETAQDGNGRHLTVTAGGETRSYSLPMHFDSLTDALTCSVGINRLTVPSTEKCAILDGKKIKLTDGEWTLLSLLVSAGGDFVSREKILANCFSGKSESMINVYIHYLREKLECGGEKIIVASRDSGYKIDKRFLGGENLC